MPAWEQRWKKPAAVIRCGTMRVTPVTITARSAPMLPVDNVMPELSRIAVFGGIYSNHLALAAALQDARRLGVDAFYCLGDLGAFGPHPDRVFPLLWDWSVACIQGNYDNSIGNDLPDCQCGYTDPRDNHFARISYTYTLSHTDSANQAWMRELPGQRRIQLGHYCLLMCDGSPRRMNEFLWESTTPTHFLEYLADEHQTDVILATHTGIKWHRPLGPTRGLSPNPQGDSPLSLGPKRGLSPYPQGDCPLVWPCDR